MVTFNEKLIHQPKEFYGFQITEAHVPQSHMLFLFGPSSTSQSPLNCNFPPFSLFPDYLLLPSPPPQEMTEEICSVIFGLSDCENFVFQASEDCWTAFFKISDNSKLVWIHDINLGMYGESRMALPCLELKERNIHFLSLPFLLRQYFFLLVGWCILLTFQEKSVSDVQVIIRENQKKCNYKEKGTSSFLVWNAQRKI